MADVTVSLRCPNIEPMNVRTGSDGRFRIEGIGSIAENCIVQVSHEGHVPQTFPATELCAFPLDGIKQCNYAALRLQLQPVTSPPTP